MERLKCSVLCNDSRLSSPFSVMIIQRSPACKDLYHHVIQNRRCAFNFSLVPTIVTYFRPVKPPDSLNSREQDLREANTRTNYQILLHTISVSKIIDWCNYA